MRMWWMDRIVRNVLLCIGVCCMCFGAGCLGAQKAVVQAKAPSPPPPPPPPVVKSASQLAEEAAHASFDVFTVEWIKKRTQAQQAHRKVTKARGGFVVEYAEALPTRFLKVKKTTSEVTPFVGILSYYQKTFWSTGKTKKKALSGPFEEGETQSVSEIFRYTEGQWVY